MTGRLLRVAVGVVVVLTSWAVGNLHGQDQTPADPVTRAELTALRQEFAAEITQLRADVKRLTEQTKPGPRLLK